MEISSEETYDLKTESQFDSVDKNEIDVENIDNDSDVGEKKPRKKTKKNIQR